MPSERKPSVVIIGAGVGGLSTACRLSQTGLYDSITVVEKNQYLGGRCSLLHHPDGFRFDQGPSLLLMPEIFKANLHDMAIPDDAWEFLACDPHYDIYYASKDPNVSHAEKVTMWDDDARLKPELERVEPGSWAGYLGFLKESSVHYAISVSQVLATPMRSFSDMVRLDFAVALPKLHLFSSVYTRASRYFKSDVLRRAFSFQSMYLGMSPLAAPGTYSLLAFTECAHGVWYPRGGFGHLFGLIEAKAKANGVTFLYGTAVSRIEKSPDYERTKRVSGVVLDNGASLEADLVVVNADLVYAYQHLLPPTPYGASLADEKQGCGAFVFHFGMKRKMSELNAHSIFLADEYEASFDDIFEKGDIPKEPSFYVHIPSRVDASAAPPGCDAVTVLVPIGLKHATFATLGDKKAYVKNVEAKARQAILSRLDKLVTSAGAKDTFSANIKFEVVHDPLWWENEFNLAKGSILGLSHGIFQVLSFRPKMHEPSLFKNVFFVGASTHPGTGVPIVLQSAKLASEMVQQFTHSLKWSKEERLFVDTSSDSTLSAVSSWRHLLVAALVMWVCYALPDSVHLILASLITVCLFVMRH
jgi:phytoene desaturase (3,4-didehydrolycopene-forming)